MTTLLAVEDLTFRYRRGAVPVVDGLTASFDAGTVTAVTGASGAGKSTLLYVLALLLKASSGQVLWAGEPVARLSDAERARLRASRAGFIFQDAMLDPARTVLDNVCEAGLFAGMTTTASRARSGELMERFGVAHRSSHRPGEISGGQAQRVALCRALLTRPQVVFGDEPTGNLDRASAHLVWDALVEHARTGAVVVVATHDQDLVSRADRRLVIP